MSPKIPPPPPSGKTESVQIRPFWKAYTDIFETSLSAYEKIILTAVASWPDGQCHYSEKTLARYASCSTKTIQRSIKTLADQGLLFVTPISGTTNIYRTIPWTQSPTPLDTESIPPWTESPDPLDTQSTDKNIYKINYKIRDKNTVADAPPLPIESLETLSQESDSLEEPIEVSEAPPLPAPPPKAKKAKQPESGWAEVQAAATPEQWESIEMWRKHRTQMKKPCTPLSVMQNLKKYGSDLSAAIEHSIEKGWQGIYFSGHTQSLGASGLTFQQQQMWFRDVWNEAHDLDRLDLSWVTKEQGAFLRKLMGRLYGTEAAYVEALAKKRPDQFKYELRDFTNAIKELEQELSK